MNLTRHDITVDGVRLAVRVGGDGPPLVLLHGYPQNHRCWSKVLPALLPHFTCILPDLRGYGDSDAPPDDAAHETYSKRRMALDLCGILDALGYAQTHVLGHDRGARVAYRFALDHPARLRRLGIIEIVPTGDFWEGWTAEIAMKAYHWTFLAQPSPLPERMIGADPEGYLLWTLKSWVRGHDLGVFPEPSLESYRAQIRRPETIAAMCADYRAGATYDRALDKDDKARGAQIKAPTLFLWGHEGFPASTGDAAGLWRAWAPDLEDQAIVSGHFAMEENPDAVVKAVVPFFQK
jgi:haloacetate dehalogenase